MECSWCFVENTLMKVVDVTHHTTRTLDIIQIILMDVAEVVLNITKGTNILQIVWMKGADIYIPFTHSSNINVMQNNDDLLYLFIVADSLHIIMMYSIRLNPSQQPYLHGWFFSHHNLNGWFHSWHLYICGSFSSHHNLYVWFPSKYLNVHG